MALTRVSAIIERQNVRGVFLSAFYPFSSSVRFEVSGSTEAVSFSRETRTAVYEGGAGRNLINQTRETVPLGPAFYLGYGSAALVRDTTLFGATHPVFGERARLEIGRTTGSLEYTNLLVDGRRYFMPVRPWTVAVRALHYGRYGRDGDSDQLIDLYSGYPEFVHGYGIGSFSAVECLGGTAGEECDVFRSLLGSRMAVANIELRAPIPGLFSGEVEYSRLPIDIALFADAGVAWTSGDLPQFAGGSRRLVRSIGGAVRINLFGLVPIEVAVSRPLDRVDRKLRWQIGVRQGF